MVTKNNGTKKAPAKNQKSTMIKIAETIGQVAGELSVKKDQLTDMASHAIDAVKSKIHDITAKKVEAAEKLSPKKTVKAVEKKVVKPVAKKAEAVKKAVTKTVKKAAKKAAPLKKEAKKMARKK